MEQSDKRSSEVGSGDVVVFRKIMSYLKI